MTESLFTGQKSNSTFQPWIDQLIESYKKKQAREKNKIGPKISAIQTLSSLAKIYETVRNSVDLRAEQLFIIKSTYKG